MYIKLYSPADKAYLEGYGRRHGEQRGNVDRQDHKKERGDDASRYSRPVHACQIARHSKSSFNATETRY